LIFYKKNIYGPFLSYVAAEKRIWLAGSKPGMNIQTYDTETWKYITSPDYDDQPDYVNPNKIKPIDKLPLTVSFKTKDEWNQFLSLSAGPKAPLNQILSPKEFKKLK